MKSLIYSLFFFIFGFFLAVLLFKTNFLAAMDADIKKREIAQETCVEKVIKKGSKEAWNVYDDFKEQFYK